ncbi:MAG TPA: PrsW family glutamic-type intramembrane protease [Cytophagaceae bacterium]
MNHIIQQIRDLLGIDWDGTGPVSSVKVLFGSVYFWILAGTGLYILYLYISSRNKKTFFKSPFVLTFTLTCLMLLGSFVIINLTFPEPLKDIEPEEEAIIEDRINEDAELLKKAERDFLNIQLQHEYITSHFDIPQYYRDSTGFAYERDDYTITNFYLDRLTYADPAYVDMARLCLGLTYYFRDSLRHSLTFFNQLEDKNKPYYRFYQGLIYMMLEDTARSISEFQVASRLNDGYSGESYEYLIYLLQNTGQEEKLLTLLSDPQAAMHFPDKLAINLHFKSNNLPGYFYLIIKNALKNVKWIGFVAAVVILIVWLSYIVRIDIFEREDLKVVGLILLYGMSFTFLAFYFYDFLKHSYGFTKNGEFFNDLLYCIFGIGVVEEFVKILPLILLLLIYPSVLSEAYDYILYASVSALGFAFVENLIYFGGDLSGIISGRAMTSVPGHIVNSSIVAYGFVLSRYRYKNFPVWISFPLFFLIGSISHGLYDFWLFRNIYGMFFLHFLVSISFWVMIVNNCINNSPYFSYRLQFRHDHLQTWMGVSLTVILILQYAAVAWEKGPVYANDTFNSTLLIGGIFIVYYTDKLANMDLVKGYWNSIALTTIADKRRRNPFNLRLFFFRLISGDIIPHTFVGAKVMMQCDPENNRLNAIITQPVSGEVYDRIVVTCYDPVSKKEFKDPYWFKLESETPLIIKGKSYHQFYIRFIDERPSFNIKDTLDAYLYIPREGGALNEKPVFRKQLLSMGNVELTLQEKK